MNKTVSTLRPVGDDEPAARRELSAELQLAFTDVAELAREGLLAMSVGIGLRVMTEMMEAEVTDRVGPKHAKIPGRTASRHASAHGSVVLGGRRVPISRPRARTVGGTEVELDTYATFAADDLLTQVVLERMLAGVATRRHRAVAEPVGRSVDPHRRFDIGFVGVPPVQGGHRHRVGGADEPRPVGTGRCGHDDRRCPLRRAVLRGRPGHLR